MDVVWQALGHAFGLDNGSGPIYLAWSGVGSDIAELAIFVALYTWLRKSNCHVKGCWRIGLRQVPGTPHHTCHKHHPLPPPSADDVVRAHRRSQHRAVTKPR